MRRVALLAILSLLLWACTGGASTTTTTTAPTSTTTGSSTSSTTISSTSTAAVQEWPEVLVTNQDGVFYIDSVGEVTRLVKGRVAYAVDDTRGGLSFQVERGRSSMWWGGEPHVKSTEVWWVPQGASTAQALLVATPGQPLDLSLIDVFDADGKTLVMYVRHDSTMDPEHGPHGWVDSLRVFDLDSSEVSELTMFPGYEHSYGFSTGGGLILVDEEDVAGTSYYFLDIARSDGASVPVVPQLEGCWEDDRCPWRGVLSPDGAAVAYVGEVNASVEEHVVRVADISSGEVTVEVQGTAASLDLGDEYLIVNKEVGRSLMVSLSDPSQRHEVAVSGTARFVTAPVDIDAPVIPPTPAAIQLRADGLGLVDFGDPVDEVMAVLVRVLGEPDQDSIVNPAAKNRWMSYGATEYFRDTSWESWGLHVVFTDGGYFRDDGVPHLIAWSGRSALATAEGIGVGSTVAELQAKYGDRLSLPSEYSDECYPGWFFEIGPLTPQQGNEQGADQSRLGWYIDGQLDGDPAKPETKVVGLHSGAHESC